MMLLDRRHLLMRTTALLGAASWPRTVAAAPPELRRTTDIDAVLQAGVEAGDLPGVVAMAATERTVLYQGCFGFREINRRTAMTPDTIFRIASMVKLLTSVAAMQLVEQGRLGLDEPAARLLPTLASPQVLTGFDAKGDPQLRPARSPITLRHLLTHTSGFSYSLWDENALHYQQRARRSKSLPRRPLAFDPGTKWAYGTSIDRVSNLVEAASGKTIDRYFRDHILDPLGMSDTGFALTDKRREREANLHVRKDGALSPVPLEKKGPPPESFSGGGGIYSSAFDYMRLLQALLGRGSFNGATILRPETVALMGQNQIGDIEAGIMTTTSSRIRKRQFHARRPTALESGKHDQP